MSVWNELRSEFNDAPHKSIRQKYIQKYVKASNRNLIIYATDFASGNKPGNLVMLDAADKQTFADVMRDLDPTKGLDIMIESPGGMGEIAEAIAHMLRSRFSSIRFIVPNMAKSAATVLVLSADEILMNEQSELGPIDPQMPVRQPNGELRYSPAHIIIQQFLSIVNTIKTDKVAGSTLAPFLQVYFPSLIQECHNAKQLINTIAIKLLTDYMFKGDIDANAKAIHAASILSDFQHHLSHGRSLNIDFVTNVLKLKVVDLRTIPKLDLLVNKIYICIKETFNRNPHIVKICENCKGHGTVLQWKPALIGQV